MQNRPAKTVLLIEDEPEHSGLIREMLKDQGSCIFELTHVRSVGDAVIHLAKDLVDIVLLDLGLTNLHGLELVRRVRTAAPRVSIVLLSSADDEPIAVQAMQEGAQDYLIKGQIEARELIRSLLNAAERKTIEEIQFVKKERAQDALNCIGDAVICTDPSGDITFLNHVATTMTGWSVEEAVGRPMAECVRIVDGLSGKVILDPMVTATSQNREGSLPLNSILVRRDGHETHIEDSVAPIHDREGHVTGAVMVFRDVSATRAFEKALTESAQHDFLTGLPNRTLLKDRITQAISLAHRQRCHAAVLFLDLDGFKQINDSLGHLIGDKVLQSVAKRLLECVRSPDTVIRHGGDEFIVVLQELKYREDAVVTVARLLKIMSAAHFVESHEILATISIGVSVYPDDGMNADRLIRNADIAMYDAKRNGKLNYRFFKSEMALQHPEYQSAREELWRGLDWHELTSTPAAHSNQ